MPNTDVFLAYSHKDSEKARWLELALKDHGLSVFKDDLIPPGTAWQTVVEKYLQDAISIVVLLSEHLDDSLYLQDEALYAKDHGKLIPVIIGHIPSVPFGYKALHASNLIDWTWPTPHQHIPFTVLVDTLHQRVKQARLETTPPNAAVDDAEQDDLPVCPSCSSALTNRLYAFDIRYSKGRSTRFSQLIEKYACGFEQNSGAEVKACPHKAMPVTATERISIELHDYLERASKRMKMGDNLAAINELQQFIRNGGKRNLAAMRRFDELMNQIRAMSKRSSPETPKTVMQLLGLSGRKR